MLVLNIWGFIMRLEWIDDILAVLDSGSLARAAERRFLTQSAFTRRVRLIEDSVGAPLFDRRRKPVTLMPGVQALEPELRHLSAQLRRIRSDLRADASPSRKTLSFACQHAITTTISPWIVRALTAHSDASVRVRSGNRDECLMQLLSGEVDFAVMYDLPDTGAPVGSRAFEALHIGSDLLLPVCTPPLESAARSGRFPMIRYPSDVFLGHIFDHAIAPNLDESVSGETKAETALTLAANQFALQGIGVAWLPKSLVQRSLDKGDLIRLDDQLPAQALDIRLILLSKGQDERSDAVWQDVASMLAASANLQGFPHDETSFVQSLKRAEK